MTQVKHVIPSHAYADAVGKLNTASQTQLALLVAQKAQTAFDQLATETQNKLLVLEVKANEALRKANLLEDDEKAQLEEALREFLTSSGVGSLLSAMSITIDGVPYTVESALKMLIQSDQIVDREPTYDAASGNLISEKYTLQDGHIALMEFTAEAVMDANSEPTGDIKFNGTCFNWRNGVPAYEHFVARPEKMTVTLFGNAVDVTNGWRTVQVRNIVLDISSALAQASSVNSAVPDLNGDGTIGIPAAPAAPDAGTGEAGTGETGTGGAI